VTVRPNETLPLAIAHRAGNHLDQLQPAVQAGADLIEADVWLHRGNLEVRHLKTLGPVPILWDRWKLVSGRAPRLYLRELLEAWPKGAELMIDMKGEATAFPDTLAKALEMHHKGRPVTFSGRVWDLLKPLSGFPGGRFFPSCGYQEQVGELLDQWQDYYDAAVLHASLVTDDNVRAVKDMGASVITWPVNTVETLDEVISAGASGVISDSLDIVRKLAARRPLEAPDGVSE
jgi:glycerophosphoryl diester phosphodiesterase